MKLSRALLLAGLLPGLAPSLHAHDTKPANGSGTITLDETVIEGKAEDLLGIAPAASKGQSSAEELAARSFLRRGELLEVVPGVVITQHSGGGKANQYFLRGFNLDHGTDFGIFVEGMPVNLRTHGHGQGYADLNFLIPEMVERLDYHKGPYFARLGDFTTAGAAEFSLYDVMPEGLASVTVGKDDYYRFVIADTIEAGAGSLTYGFEYNHYNGPWVLPESFNRWNGVLRYHIHNDDEELSVTLMGYRGTWDATDQVPQRAIRSGLIDRFGYIDDTVGGETQRYSLSADWLRHEANGTTKVRAYVGYYDLDLYSNFTYFLDNPVDGDQFHQADSRWFAGTAYVREFEWDFKGRQVDVLLGTETRHDWISGVGLHKTKARERLSTVREDDVTESSFSAYAEKTVHWADWFRTQGGLRADLYHFDITARTLPENSGSEWAHIFSPKVGAVFGPWHETELYLNGGLGFHSNDARGVTIRTDPATGEPADIVDPLVRTYGAEAGVRTQIVPNLLSTLSVWYLQSDSELVYIGDAGNTEAGEGSERYGVEWSNYWRPTSWLAFDSEFTVTEARFLDTHAEIENSIPYTLSAGVSVGEKEGWHAGLRTRFFSARPLSDDGSIESSNAFQVNAKVGWRKGNWEIAGEVLNLFDRRDNDIEYYYTSRLPGERQGGFDDHHIHPMEERTFRLTVTRYW